MSRRNINRAFLAAKINYASKVEYFCPNVMFWFKSNKQISFTILWKKWSPFLLAEVIHLHLFASSVSRHFLIETFRKSLKTYKLNYTRSRNFRNLYQTQIKEILYQRVYRHAISILQQKRLYWRLDTPNLIHTFDMFIDRIIFGTFLSSVGNC